MIRRPLLDVPATTRNPIDLFAVSEGIDDRRTTRLGRSFDTQSPFDAQSPLGAERGGETKVQDGRHGYGCAPLVHVARIHQYPPSLDVGVVGSLYCWRKVSTIQPFLRRVATVVA